MHLNTERMWALDSNEVNFHLGFQSVYSLYLSGLWKGHDSSCPACLVILHDPERQATLLCFVTYTVGWELLQIWGCIGTATQGGRCPWARFQRKEKWWDMPLDEDVSLRGEGVTTSRLVVKRVSSGKGSKFNLRLSLNPLYWSRASW